jgi:hypothetical protein
MIWRSAQPAPMRALRGMVFLVTGHCPNKVLFSAPLYILRREVKLWKYSRAVKNYRVDKAVTS